MEYKKAWGSTLAPVSKKRLTRVYDEGEVVGSFTVIKCLNPTTAPGVHRVYRVKCNNCGRTFSLRSTLIAKQRGCGCIALEQLRVRSTIHGHYYERLHRIWYGMKKRCEDRAHHAYKDYGGRGITVCKEWEDYETFYRWAIYAGYRQNLTLERKDVDKGYCPQNCKFVSLRMQATNKRNSIRDNNGKSLTEMVLRCDIKALRDYGLKIWPQAVKKRAGYKCELCERRGDNVVLDAHHWGATKASNAPTDLWLSNGCCLCRDCHIKAHTFVAEYKERIAALKGGRLALSRIELGRHKKNEPKKLLEAIKRIKKQLKKD